MQLSVIIPIYKTEDYLEACVDSVLSCASEKIEVILVDDGSPDRCPEICDAYAEADSRVKIIHKENGGLSSARNTGMSAARGKYVTFVDSDDLIYGESLTDILEWTCLGEADICFLHTEKFFPDGTFCDLGENIEGEQLRGRGREAAIKYLATRPKYPGSAWAKLYKRDFLLKNDIHFPYDRRYSEDMGFIRDCILRANNFDALEIPFYRYRQNRQGSITSNVSAKNFNDLFLFVSETDEKLNARNNSDPTIKSFMRFVSYEYLILLYLYTQLPREGKKACFQKLKEYKWTLTYAISKKEKIIRIICSLFGIRFTAFLMKQYRRAVER